MRSVFFLPRHDPIFSDEGSTIARMGPLLTYRLGAMSFGPEVGTVCIHVYYIDGAAPRWRTRYLAMPASVDGRLEFPIKPETRLTGDVAELIGLLRSALAEARPHVRKRKIAGFDTTAFFAELDTVLAEIAAAPGVWERIGEMRLRPSISGVGLGRVGDLGVYASFFQPAEAFPAVVLKILERDLPEARKAAESKDRERLAALIEGINQKTAPWLLAADNGASILAAFPECAEVLSSIPTLVSSDSGDRHQALLDACRITVERTTINPRA